MATALAVDSPPRPRTVARGGGGGACPPSSRDLSCRCLLHLYLRFWNQIFTWVDVSFRLLARCSRSGADRYRCCLNLRSSSKTWA